MRSIRVRKFNPDRGIHETVFEADNEKGEYSVGTGNRDMLGIPTYTGDIVEGDIQTPMGLMRRRGVVEFDLNRTQFVINFTGLDPVWGTNLPVTGVRIIGNVRINPEILETR